MSKVLYLKDGRIGRITLNRPEVMNAIDDDLPVVHVFQLAGHGDPIESGIGVGLVDLATGTGPVQ